MNPDLRRADEAVIEAAHAEALLTEASRVLHRIYRALMISPQGYHQKGAASKAFSIIMDNLGIVTWAWDQDYAAVCRGKHAPDPPADKPYSPCANRDCSGCKDCRIAPPAEGEKPCDNPNHFHDDAGCFNCALVFDPPAENPCRRSETGWCWTHDKMCGEEPKCEECGGIGVLNNSGDDPFYTPCPSVQEENRK